MNETLAASGGHLLLAIRALLPSLNEQEQKVGQYILSHPHEVVHLAVSDLAHRAAVSDATVFRFCKKMGASGYQDFKIRLAQDVAATSVTSYSPVAPQDSLEQAMHKVIASDIKALEDTLLVLDRHALSAAVEALHKARRVDIYGSGGAAVAALELQYKLIRVGVRGVAHTDAEMQVISAALLTPPDVAVAISHSGESQDTNHAAGVAQEAGATLISVTNHPNSSLSMMADISLITAAQEALAHGYPLGARVAQVALIDVLYAGLTLKRQEESDRSLSRIAGALQHRQS